MAGTLRIYTKKYGEMQTGCQILGKGTRIRQHQDHVKERNRQLYKALIIGIIILLTTGCAAVRKGSSDKDGESLALASIALRQAGNRNLTNSGFFIQKGKISTSGEAGRINLIFTMRYVKPGNYLISLRSITGIEAFRVFITEDTVLINDRLNEELLYGKPVDFEKITGIHPELLRVSLGDFITENADIIGDEGCAANEMGVESYYKGLKINSIIDCKLEKVKSIELESSIPDEKITIEYKKNRFDYYRVPRKVEINDTRRKVKITIKIERYICPWIGEIEFIPGSGYSRKSLI